MELNLLNLPDELLLEILSYHCQVKFDKFKNVRYLIQLSTVCRKFYYICHKITDNKFFLIYSYISLCNQNELNKNHKLLTNNILTNWSNINVILSFHYKHELSLFHIYEKELLHYKNIHLSFNIEDYVEEFINFYYEKYDILFKKDKNKTEKQSRISINIYFYNEFNFPIYRKLNLVKNKFIFRNVSFNNCRGINIPDTIKTEKLKLYNCKTCTLNLNCDNLKIVNIKNSRAIIIYNIKNVKLVSLRCSYNIVFECIENINQLKVIESRVIFNKPLLNINYLFIKMINNYFIIPSNSIIFKIIYLYKYYINIYTIEAVKSKYHMDDSKVSIIDLHRSSKQFIY